MIPYQIDCSIASNDHFCTDVHKIEASKIPDVVVFKNGKINDYFRRKFPNTDDFTFANMNLFLKTLGNLNPYKKKIKIPKIDVAACCKAIVVTGDNLGSDNGEGKYILRSYGSASSYGIFLYS